MNPVFQRIKLARTGEISKSFQFILELSLEEDRIQLLIHQRMPQPRSGVEWPLSLSVTLSTLIQLRPLPLSSSFHVQEVCIITVFETKKLGHPSTSEKLGLSPWERDLIPDL